MIRSISTFTVLVPVSKISAPVSASFAVRAAPMTFQLILHLISAIWHVSPLHTIGSTMLINGYDDIYVIRYYAACLYVTQWTLEIEMKYCRPAVLSTAFIRSWPQCYELRCITFYYSHISSLFSCLDSTQMSHCSSVLPEVFTPT